MFKHNYHGKTKVNRKKHQFERINEITGDKQTEWSRWAEARRDMETIEKQYFYKEDKDINELRIDLRQIFQATQIRILSDLRFDYDDWEEEDMKKVRVSFTLAGSYATLKKFIHQIEIHPKFLMIERIDFRDIDPQSGMVELNIELAGYYEN